MFKDLPKANELIKAGTIINYGTLALMHCLSDRISPYHDIT
jgi:hypothetical protein